MLTKKTLELVNFTSGTQHTAVQKKKFSRVQRGTNFIISDSPISDGVLKTYSNIYNSEDRISFYINELCTNTYSSLPFLYLSILK